MLEFRTLGRIELCNEDGTLIHEPLRHAKRTALLAYLASRHPVRSHRRETLIALLWPGLDENHGRGMLRHEIYELRRALGSDVILSDGRETVGANKDLLWCDARVLSQGLADGHLIEALDLVLGEFLPGLHVDGGEFDRWLDGERGRLGRQAGKAAERLCALAATSGDLPAAVRWARRWADLAPYDEVAWRRLISLLDQEGGRAEALSAYDELVSRLRHELEIEPAPETRALADTIRTRAEVGGADDPIREQSPVPSAVDMPNLRVREADRRQPVPVVIVIQFVENLTGDPRHDALARRLTDQLAGAIADLHFVKVVVGSEAPWSSAVVSATLYGYPDGIQAATQLAEPGTGGRVLAVPEPVILDPDPGDEELDEVVARIMASVAAQYDPRVPMAFVGGIPDRTPSWKAWREFIRGSEAFGGFRFEEAARLLRRANQIDPSFVKAGTFAALAVAYCGDPAGAEALAIESLEAGEETATEYERLFTAWFLAELRGRRAEAYRACRDVTTITSHPVLQFMCGREAYRLNRPWEALGILEGMEVGGLGWWRRWVEFYEVVGGSLHVLGAHHAELDAVSGGRVRYPEALEPMRAEVRARAALGEPRAALDIVDEALTVPTVLLSPSDVAWTAAQELDAHGHPEAGAVARHKALAWMVHRQEPTHADRLLEVRLLLEMGELEQAAMRLRELAPFEALKPLDALEALGLAGLVAAGADDAEGAIGLITQLEGTQNPYLTGRHLLHAAGIHAALGDHTGAIDTLRRAFASGLPFGVELHALHMLRSLVSHPEFETLLRPRGPGVRDVERLAPTLVAL
jgi:DNA-binding SARP family transcriptional activator